MLSQLEIEMGGGVTLKKAGKDNIQSSLPWRYCQAALILQGHWTQSASDSAMTPPGIVLQHHGIPQRTRWSFRIFHVSN